MDSGTLSISEAMELHAEREEKMNTKKAAVVAAARGSKLHSSLYHTSPEKSTQKVREGVGELLLTLQTSQDEEQRQEMWRLFEDKLRHLVELRVGGQVA